jgi:hypothetical protein
MKRKIIFLVKFVFALTVSIICLEIFLRTSEISLPSPFVEDGHLGITFRPESDIIVLQEGFFMGKINKYGYIGSEYKTIKDSGVFRIALIGDSYVEGFHLFNKYHFGKILEKKLSKHFKKKTEVLNFGMAGTDFREMYIRYKQFASKFNPDLTLFFINKKDVLQKEKKVGPNCNANKDSVKINFAFSQSAVFKNKVKIQFLRHSSFYSLVKNSFTIIKSNNTDEILFGKLASSFTEKVISNKIESDVELKKLNSLIFTNLAKENIVLVTSEQMNQDYNCLIEKSGVKEFPLHKYLISLRENGIRHNFWKATKKEGHWNHKTHERIAFYLFEKIKTYISEKITSKK